MLGDFPAVHCGIVDKERTNVVQFEAVRVRTPRMKRLLPLSAFLSASGDIFSEAMIGAPVRSKQEPYWDLLL